MSVSGYGQQAKQEPDIETRMMAMRSAWDQSSPDCRFKVSLARFQEPRCLDEIARVLTTISFTVLLLQCRGSRHDWSIWSTGGGER